MKTLRTTLPGASTLAALLLLLLLLAGPAASRAQEEAGGAVPLFNGKDLTGWVVAPDDGGHWKVVDGAIDYHARSES